MKSKRGRRALLVSLAVIIFICALAFTYMQYLIVTTGANAAPAPSDVIIVLGHSIEDENTPGAWLMARLDTAKELYDKGYAPSIIVCGGKGSGDNVSVASVMKAWLCAQGVPDDSVITEELSRNTDENLEFSKAICDEYGYKTVILVTNDFHVYRSVMTAKAYFPEDCVSAGGAALDFEIRKLFAYLKEPFSIIKHKLRLSLDS